MNELFGDDNDNDGDDVYIQCILYIHTYIYIMLECLNVCHAFAYLFPTVPSGGSKHFLAVL